MKHSARFKAPDMVEIRSLLFWDRLAANCYVSGQPIVSNLVLEDATNRPSWNTDN